jgi:hypothetical protein
MKIRSKALYDYLLQANVLTDTPEAIARAKQAYRKLYKRNWKGQARSRKEIRFTVTLQQYAAIKNQAQAAHVRPTAYAKAAVLERIGQPAIHNERLLAILQLVGMATIALHRDNPRHRAYGLLRDAEIKLLAYLNIQP